MVKIFKLSIACTLEMAYNSQPIIKEIDELANIDIQSRIGSDIFIYDNFIIYDAIIDHEPLGIILDDCNTAVNNNVFNESTTIVDSPDDIGVNDVGVVVEEIISFLNPFTLDLITKIYRKNNYDVLLVDVTKEVLLEDSEFIERFGITEDAIRHYKEGLTMDDFLTKISNFGIHSLTLIDKAIMENMSK